MARPLRLSRSTQNAFIADIDEAMLERHKALEESDTNALYAAEKKLAGIIIQYDKKLIAHNKHGKHY